MKWTNKGHEFDVLGDMIKDLRSVYLFGAGVHGKTVAEKYGAKINIKGFIDSDTKKQGVTFCGLPVFVPGVELLRNESIIITTQPSFADEISKQLSAIGYTDNVYPMQIFLPVLDAYRFNETCLTSVSFLPTTVCNLRCKHCLNFSPYVKEHQIRPIEWLKTDLDLLLSKIDTILLLHISGGEPFTYPHLPELIEHIAAKHGNKLGRLEMTTNGTILPTERLLSAMRGADLYLTVDDYRAAVPQYRDKYDELLKLLNEYKISYRILKADSWIDLTRPSLKKDPLCEERLCERFNTCAVPWQEYRDGKLWLCNYAAYADIAGIQEAQPDEYFDLAGFVPENRRELMEFRLGYSAKGYTEFCRLCAGYNNNLHIVPAAEQL